jgi:hypothetical protein
MNRQDNHLAYGIAIHHFPIAMILTIFFKNAQLNSKAIFSFMITFALMTPVGTLLAAHLSIFEPIEKQLVGFVMYVL